MEVGLKTIALKLKVMRSAGTSKASLRVDGVDLDEVDSYTCARE